MVDLSKIDNTIVYLSLYDNQEPFDIGATIIKKGTKSDYSHCELVFRGHTYSSSIPDKGVRCKTIEEVYVHPENWTFIPLPWANAQAIIEFYQRTKGQRYSWGGIILCQFFNFRVSVPGYFCSEWVIAALVNGIGVPMNPQLYSPEDVRTYCLVGNIIYNMNRIL